MHGRTLQSEIEDRGFAICPGVVTAGSLKDLRDQVEPLLEGRAGLRNALAHSPACHELATGGRLLTVALEVLGAGARPVKATIFEKSPDANWKVPWHQDVAIAVENRVDVPGFGPWSVKDGVQHVEPPTEILESMVAIRLHLDDTPIENGALRVVPGSHRLGRLSSAEIQAVRREGEVVDCPVEAGSAMLLRPLLLHASSQSREPSHRRVLHVEYSAASLPGGLEWVRIDLK